jgi:hypothetical protein
VLGCSELQMITYSGKERNCVDENNNRQIESYACWRTGSMPVPPRSLRRLEVDSWRVLPFRLKDRAINFLHGLCQLP